MAKVTINRKCIMAARETVRRENHTRGQGRSVFIKRYYGSYRLIAVLVSDKQKSCREKFAMAQKMASRELKQWNRKRHWGRIAKRHGINGAHRMAVSWYYGLLKRDCISEEMVEKREDRKRVVGRKTVDVSVSRQKWEGKSMRRDKSLRRGEIKKVG